jgi:hypothetical protein
MSQLEPCPHCGGSGLTYYEWMIGSLNNPSIIKMPTPCLMCDAGRALAQTWNQQVVGLTPSVDVLG